jgi:Na+/H+ antiporter NhaB
MRRVVDGLLIVAILAGVALGAYYIGHRVDTESNNLARQDSELNQTTTGTATHHTTSNRTPIIVGIGIGGAVVALVLASLTNSFVRARRRERWHAT